MMESRLGQELARLRQLRGRNVSLREVERKTGISNEYLSQLERGIATKPAPGVLQKLAEFYEVPYQTLLVAAGYLKEPTPRVPRHSSVPRDIEAIAKTARLSNSDWQQVREFMSFIAARRRRSQR